MPRCSGKSYFGPWVSIAWATDPMLRLEAARSLGMTYLQAMRYAIIPQAVRRVIPPLMNEFVILIKDTALITVLGLVASQYELYVASQTGYSDTANATFFGPKWRGNRWPSQANSDVP